MSIVWPAVLPMRPLAESFVETAPDTSIRSEVEAGPAKVRRRFTAAPRRIACALDLSDAQIEALDAFYTTTLAGGALAFAWVHPRTGLDHDFRFLEPPRYQALARGMRWRAQLALEILP